MRTDDLAEGLLREGGRGVELRRRALSAAAGKLDALSPLAVLGRGYAAVYGLRQGAVVRSHGQLRKGDEVDVTLGRGSFRASVASTSKEAFPWRKK
jgi:exodeoxyribonuclease VII large subunit